MGCREIGCAGSEGSGPAPPVSGARKSPIDSDRTTSRLTLPCNRNICLSIPAREGASTGDGQLTGQGAAPAAATNVAPGMCVAGLGRIPRRGRRSERPGEPLRSSAHRHYERSPQDGSRAGRRAKGESPKAWRGRVRQRCPCPTPFPVTGSAEVGVEKRRGGRWDGAVIDYRKATATAPAIPFACAKDMRRRMG